MTNHMSKEQLALMLPGTMWHYFKDEPEFRAVPVPQPRPGLFARLIGWWNRAQERAELAGLSDRQLADIGLTRCELPLAFDPAFAERRNAERVMDPMLGGRTARI